MAAAAAAGILGGIAGLAIASQALGPDIQPPVMLAAAAQFLAIVIILAWALRRQAPAKTAEAARDGLVAKPLFAAAAEPHLLAAAAGTAKPAVILLELLGHNNALPGDGRLAETATRRTSELLPPGAMASWWTRDTILILLPDAPDPMPVLALTRDIITAVSDNEAPPSVGARVTCHGGIARAPADGASLAELAHSAGLALADARRPGMPGYGFFSHELAAAAKRRQDVERAVMDAIANDALHLEFQPIFKTDSGELTGFEALTRLNDPQLGAIPPSEFIPVAEQIGAINDIGRWTLEEACRVAAEWPAHVTVAVNLSPQQLLTGNLPSTLLRTLEQHGMPAYRLEIEITEGTLMTDSELVLTQLRTLRDLGVGVALDDFGTGYSSLSYLCRFPFSKIKIDRSFTLALDVSPSAKAVLRSIVKLGHSLGMAVTAEGIETSRQMSLFRDIGCDQAQGYLLGRPSPAADLSAIILRNFARGLRKQRQPRRGKAA
ncbi:MAG: putative bifunctional diguanylate cyclase/phosphodiesterase [Aestuariivirga sp.]|uniref:putative bifunctional diguanylate cyclase/phosphodiesterase n=1 Tax=Aestuariivirga sp. TaxID=2650926 RepID=UPI0038CF910B